MPCRSDHMEANTQEVYSRETAKLVVFASAKLGKPVAAYISKAADTYYGDPGHHDGITAALCALCTSMTEAQKDEIIYNGRDANSRKLAAWWDDHQKVDAAREAAEAEDARVNEIADQIRATLVQKYGPDFIAKIATAIARRG